MNAEKLIADWLLDNSSMEDAYIDSDEDTTVNTMEILFEWINDGHGLYEYLHF